MLVNIIKRPFIVRLFMNNEHPSPDDHYSLIYYTLYQYY